jgi:cytochrome b561
MPGAAGPGTISPLRYSRVAIWFHWLIAALIITNLLLGFLHDDVSRPVRSWMMFLHKSTGFVVLGLSLARLGWRLGHRPPPFDPLLRPWEAKLARGTHWLFYALMVVIPLSGWLLVSSSDRATSLFGLVEIPPLPVSRADAAHDLWEELHGILGYAVVALIALHLAGAAKHHLQGHRHLIGRMAPWLYRGT